MRWIYLSPHLDDVALSCGGLVWEQTQAGDKVEIWSICAGEPPAGELSLYARVHHKVWEVTAEEAIATRRKEDIAACEVLGAEPKYFSVPDAIYRKHPKTGEPMYTNNEELFGGVDPGDEPLVHRLMVDLAQGLSGEFVLVAPLTVGNHVDHQLVRLAADGLDREIWYYPDYPYTREFAQVIPSLVPEGYRKAVFPVSEKGMEAWKVSACQFRSQISTFWASESTLREELQVHAESFGGVTLSRPK
ncbi:MAG: PIG-L family deacetylase [Anaerolineales bacterium]